MARTFRPHMSAGFMLFALVSAAGAADPPKSDATAKPLTSDAKAEEPKARSLGIVLYEGFEPLDVYGPVEVFGNVPGLKLHMIAEKAGPVKSVMGNATVAEFGLNDAPELDLVLVPGGIGTLKQLNNKPLHEWLRQRADKAEIVMSVCSGSAILARAGLLDGRKATTNKQSFKLLTAAKSDVTWVKEARWVDEGDRVTSSGVSAGIDMSLHVVERLWGAETAEAIADGTEYTWNRDPNNDPFAKFAE
jgi:transcriptional regulator GlxA family with amidase domain